jgi:hypothetical protein
MMPIDHEVDLAELHRDDRREVARRKRRCKCAQPLPARLVPRLEVARERRYATLGSDDVGERNRLDPQRAAGDCRQPAFDVLQGQKVIVGH